MRALLRAILVIVLVAFLGLIAFNWWSGGSGLVAFHRADSPAQPQVDLSKARERGAEVGEKAAQAAKKIQESVAEAGVSAKIKAKMALDDRVRARDIDVSTSGATVTLSGTVRSSDERERAEKLARETDGVSRVVDKLDVRP